MRKDLYRPLCSRFIAGLLMLDNFTFSQKDGVLSLDVEVAGYRQSFTGSVSEPDNIMVELGGWIVTLPKSVWYDRQ